MCIIMKSVFMKNVNFSVKVGFHEVYFYEVYFLPIVFLIMLCDYK